jgi:L-amino acid N-acyltransferase YncA
MHNINFRKYYKLLDIYKEALLCVTYIYNLYIQQSAVKFRKISNGFLNTREKYRRLTIHSKYTRLSPVRNNKSICIYTLIKI